MTKRLRGVGLHGRAAQAARVTLKTTLYIGAALMASLAVGSTAKAQVVSDSARKPFAFSVGDFLPTSKDARQAGGTHNMALTADYTVQQLPESSSISQISIGFIERDHLRIIPVTVSQVYRDPGTGRENLLGVPYYYGFGLGLYGARVALPDTSGKAKILLGGFVSGGLDITKTIFLDAKYHYMAKYDKKFLGGLQFSLGARF